MDFFAGAFVGVIIWNLIFNNWDRDEDEWIEEIPKRKYRRYS